LIQLPIRDAVRTSILSRKWRYKWSTITQLVFDEKCYPNCHDREAVQKIVVEFITRLLFLHQGPIHKFQIVNTSLQNCSAINQWILFLSRNDIKDLDLELAEGGEFFRMPSCFFGCEKLTRLELSRCELDPPASFKGFSCLKSLNLHQVLISPEAIESLISSCPLLESLSLSYFDCLALTVCAPNLKYLCLEGEFKEICLVDTPLLVELSVAMYMTDDVAEHMEQSSTCNFVKFLGGVPNLERLVGLIDFTKVTFCCYSTKILTFTLIWDVLHAFSSLILCEKENPFTNLPLIFITVLVDNCIYLSPTNLNLLFLLIIESGVVSNLFI
jgi:hypothetical protein